MHFLDRLALFCPKSLRIEKLYIRRSILNIMHFGLPCSYAIKIAKLSMLALLCCLKCAYYGFLYP